MNMQRILHYADAPEERAVPDLVRHCNGRITVEADPLWVSAVWLYDDLTSVYPPTRR